MDEILFLYFWKKNTIKLTVNYFDLFPMVIYLFIFFQVGRIKQKRGYKDQWPWNIKIYTDEAGNNKGDACLAYEDPSAAHSAGGFYNSIYRASSVA